MSIVRTWSRIKPEKHISLLMLVILFITACGAKATELPVFQGDNPYAPLPADSQMQVDDIVVESSMLALTKSLPPQAMLRLIYFPPTACHQVRIKVSGPDSQNNINVKAYSVVEKDQACILMAITTPLDAAINLDSFPSGHYKVYLNETLIGEFDS